MQREGVGYLFDGVAFIAAGSAILGLARLPQGLGWIGVAGGGASALTVAGAETPLAFLAAGLYMPGLALIVAFRVWAGIRLWRDSPWHTEPPASVSAHSHQRPGRSSDDQDRSQNTG